MMSNNAFELYPTELKLDAEGALVIHWSDESTQRLPAEFLRRECPCAICIEKRIAKINDAVEAESTPGQLPVIRSDQPASITIEGMTPLGNYAYRIDFNDRHTSGVYTLEYLYSLQR